MRNTFIDSLIKLAKKDSSVYLLTADLGYGYVERFGKLFPNRFINVGIAEQNMMNIATGLAMCGKTVFTYSIATFTTMRCYEQIRNYIAYYNLKVRIVGVGGQNCYPTLGFSHNCPEDEDLKIMKSLPNVETYNLQNKRKLKQLIKSSPTINHPLYIRILR